MQIHGTVVSWQGQGCLLVGASGSGKSLLALQLITLGAQLVADDVVLLSPTHGQWLARAPQNLVGMIEVYGLGPTRLPAAHWCAAAPLMRVVNLTHTAPARLPEEQTWQPPKLCTPPCPPALPLLQLQIHFAGNAAIIWAWWVGTPVSALVEMPPMPPA